MERYSKYIPALSGIVVLQLCALMLLAGAFTGQQFWQLREVSTIPNQDFQSARGQGFGTQQFGQPQDQSTFPGQGSQSQQGQGSQFGQRPSNGASPNANQPNNRTGNNSNQPAGDRVGGRVTAVNGSTISVENPQGSATIVTNASTKFTADGQASSLASLATGKFVNVIGQKQSDGSWIATQVSISDRPPQPGQGPQQGGQQPGTNPGAP